VEVHSREAIVLGRIVNSGARTVEDYIHNGGYQAITRALTQSPEAIIESVEIARLRGRGGAGFPVGRKWRSVFQQPQTERYIVANADEGDPGTYIDRFIMEDDPHCLIEGMAIAACAIGAKKGYVYIRNEYPEAHKILQQAIRNAREDGLLGPNILDSGFSFDIDLVTGHGSYVCGEETAMITAIEGKRPEAHPRPPHTSESGLYGKPTLVNNVETLANIPWIIRNGGNAYSNLGLPNSTGTVVVSLNSLFNKPGLYEIEFGVSMRHIIEELGGGLKTGKIKGVIVGGPLAGIIRPELLDIKFGFDELHSIGASVGHGGVVAFDENTSIPYLIHHIFSFGAFESCGRCTPCRLGSRWIEELFARIIEKGAVPRKERAVLDEMISALAMTSLCGLGTGLAEFAESALHNYEEEIDQCFV
jgi:NADH:ubiquinone oxidoreductase subunit F (NADH-binding)